MNRKAQQRSRRQHKTAQVHFFDRFESQDGSIKATVSNSEARIFYPHGSKPTVLIRLDGGEYPSPVYSDGFVQATQLWTQRHGHAFVLPGVTLYEVSQ